MFVFLRVGGCGSFCYSSTKTLRACLTGTERHTILVSKGLTKFLFRNQLFYQHLSELFDAMPVAIVFASSQTFRENITV